MDKQFLNELRYCAALSRLLLIAVKRKGPAQKNWKFIHSNSIIHVAKVLPVTLKESDRPKEWM